MPSLTQLLAEHGSLLVLDAASLNVQVGLLRRGAPALWHRARQEAGTGIFAGADALLAGAGLKLATIDAFIFCAGPGSMLGIRTTAMALRTWAVLQARPVYAYQSLALAGRHEWRQKAPRGFTVIADARRDSWHCQPVGADGVMPPLQRQPAAELPAGELVTPADFRAWAPSPRPVATCRYDLALIFPAVADGDFFQATDLPDAFQHEAPAYRKWSAQIHRAAPAPLP